MLGYSPWHVFSPQFYVSMQNHCIYPYAEEFLGIFSVQLELLLYRSLLHTEFPQVFLRPMRSTLHVLNDNINQSHGFCVSV